jgi:DNA polymerase-3 subunit alpha
MHMQRDGKPMAFLMIEDFDGAMELLVFGDTYEKFRHLIAADSMVLAHGQVSVREGDKKPKLRVDKVMALSESREKLTKSVHVRLRTQGLEESFIRDVYDVCASVQGHCPLIIHLTTEESNEYRIKAKNICMTPAREILELLSGKVGKENVWIGKSAA